MISSQEGQHMLCSVRELQDTGVEATNGPIGALHSLLFDDVGWVIRYAVVDRGHSLGGRRVLISPISVERNGIRERLYVALSREQIRQGPDVDSDEPVSRQMETALNAYYGYAPYWGGTSIWGAALHPAALSGTTAVTSAIAPADPRTDYGVWPGQETAPRLSSSRAVIGHHVAASDGLVGHVDDFLFDAGSWTIWRLVVGTPSGFSSTLRPPIRRRCDRAAVRRPRFGRGRQSRQNSE
jgi:hypothetical protein